MVKLYVEGGGNSKALKIEFRRAFSTFLRKAGIKKLPRISPGGGRQNTYNSFCTAVKNGEPAILLVDSEAPVASVSQLGNEAEKWLPWQHLKQRQGDGWEKPDGAEDLQCHLMTQCMESWFLADRDALKRFFGQGFQENQLPAIAHPVESVPKQQIYQSLSKSTHDCKTKSQYGKGMHSFKLIELIDPDKVTKASRWAKRFVDDLKKRMDGL
jgi:hypothetical protein